MHVKVDIPIGGCAVTVTVVLLKGERGYIPDLTRHINSMFLSGVVTLNVVIWLPAAPISPTVPSCTS